MEKASKISHTEIVKTPLVQEFLDGCEPPAAPPIPSLREKVVTIPDSSGTIRAVIAVDGGMTETFVREDFPSASIAFVTFGPLLIKLDDLADVDSMEFIGPDDMARLKQLRRYSGVLPSKLIPVKGQKTFSAGVRYSIHKILEQLDGELQQALAWLLFRAWRKPPERVPWTIPHCPVGCAGAGVVFNWQGPMSLPCPSCGETVYLSDALRLYERIDDQLGAGGIMGYVLTSLEHLAIVHLIRSIWEMKPGLLREVLFIKDGPLAFFGTTAPLRTPMLELMEFLGGHADGPALNLVGIEKSGPFVEHAMHIESALKSYEVLVLDNAHIRRFIVPGSDSVQPYGENMYFGGKVIFKGQDRDIFVATVPTGEFSATPKASDFYNLGDVLRTTARLRCSMYDNALLPVALANRLVSLSDVPTSDILAKFARERLGV